MDLDGQTSDDKFIPGLDSLRKIFSSNTLSDRDVMSVGTPLNSRSLTFFSKMYGWAKYFDLLGTIVAGCLLVYFIFMSITVSTPICIFRNLFNNPVSNGYWFNNQIYMF